MSLSKIDRAYKIATRMAVEDPRFIPVFERMEKIKAKQDDTAAALRRAQEITGV
jgi:hypothetical protein